MSDPGHLNFDEMLTVSLSDANDEVGYFDSSKFFKDWYFRRGQAFFFLFKKNLHVTNIQFAELLSLLRLHTHTPSGSRVSDLQFVSTAFFREWVSTIVSTLIPATGESDLGSIGKLYGELFQSTVILDTYYTSCSVFLPPSLNLDLAAVCGQSGYIHSCGSNVFVRKANKAKKEHLFDSLWTYLSSLQNGGKKVFFAVYSHEDFTVSDREIQDELRDGLDDVKIHMEKFFMGRDSLVSVFREIKRRFGAHFVVPEPGDFREKHEQARKQPDVDRSRTLWLIKDYGIDAQSFQKTSEVFFICYDQYFVNENPFHIFDENKPAWISHTTIPHTLLGAMINITRPQLSLTGQSTLCDPFVGTGTTWLEGLKFDNIVCRCSDISEIATLLARDNLEFFGQSTEELTRLEHRLTELISLVSHEPEVASRPLIVEDPAHSVAESYYKAYALADSAAQNPDSIGKEKLEDLNGAFGRLVFYLALRTKLRNIGAFERGNQDWKMGYIKETKTFGLQLARLVTLRKRQSEPLVFKTPETRAKNLCFWQGKYSWSCAPSIEVLQRAYASCEVNIGVRRWNAKDLQPNSCNLIVTDPPYGFNTNDDPAQLAELWTDALRAMILALTDGGQLVICIPDQSFTGRDVQYFMRPELITHQLLSIAAEVNKEAGVPADVVPTPSRLFRPPFYWESERALRRAILHFTFWEKGLRQFTREGEKTSPAQD